MALVLLWSAPTDMAKRTVGLKISFVKVPSIARNKRQYSNASQLTPGQTKRRWNRRAPSRSSVANIAVASGIGSTHRIGCLGLYTDHRFFSPRFFWLLRSQFELHAYARQRLGSLQVLLPCRWRRPQEGHAAAGRAGKPDSLPPALCTPGAIVFFLTPLPENMLRWP